MRTFTLVTILTLVSACRSDDKTEFIVDRDEDGLSDEEDCDDEDPNIGNPTTYYADNDRDGHGDLELSDSYCNQPIGFTTVGDDCNDADASIYPGATDVCDGIDQDCDGTIDDDAATTAFYTDADRDGYGDDATVVNACAAPEGTTDIAGDCNDADAAYNPAALEEDCTDPNDYNCDGSVGFADADADGVAACEDCDDSDGSVYPGAAEYCNSQDDDCDGSIDEEAFDAATYYADLDGDTFGDAATSIVACEQGDGWVGDATDCDDSRADISPGATEVCNELDDDCDGLIDDADATLDIATASTYYTDGDADGYGADATAVVACDQPVDASLFAGDCDDTDVAYNPGAAETDCLDPNDYNCDGSVGYADADADGYAACEECDDADAANFPGGIEVCDGEDNNCDGTADEPEAVDASTWYADSDVDAFGDGSTSTVACTAPGGYIADANDCDDSNSSVNPAQTEVCNGIDDNCDGAIDDGAADASTWYADADSDLFGDAGSTVDACDQPAGYVATGDDCNDSDGAINPGATEYCDGLDNDCNGAIDDGSTDAATWYADADTDGFGDATTTIADCSQPAGYLADNTDCDDTEFDINPAAAESCNGIDDNCDGTIDEDTAIDANTYYSDLDGDSFGDAANSADACAPEAGWVSDSTDCDDTRSDINPVATEVCNDLDDDCDGLVDDADGSLDASTASTFYTDGDADGYGADAGVVIACDQPADASVLAGDCDDTDTAYNPAALEEDCTDPNDYNCDGSVGYADDDSDGWAACEECDDFDDANYPGATEVCDGEDNDCDGSTDEPEAVDASIWYADTDADAFGDASNTSVACDAPANFVADATDCDDGNTNVNPAETEICNGIDDDCDGGIDTGSADDATWFADTDGDGFGDAASTVESCGQPAGYVANADDCDDDNGSVNPDATEVCDGIDNDCNGTIDEDTATDAQTWYADTDGDDFGDDGTSTVDCDQPAGYVADNTDCDDTASAISPDANEACNGQDDDCDGSIDEGSAEADTWYADTDSDGYGNATTATTACDAPAGYIALAGDCDDTDTNVHPFATELCNGYDDDCDTVVDEGVTSTFYADDDEDGFGDLGSTVADCSAPAGYVADNTDCDDADENVNPDALEFCDSIDNNCNGATDEDAAVDASTWYADTDSDTYGNDSASTVDCYQPSAFVADNTDCDDGNAAVNPAGTEVCNGDDDDCDGTIDEGSTDAGTWYVDLDNDSYGDASSAVASCDAPFGYIAVAGDCDDSNTDIHPFATETCNDEDDDCDTLVDDGVTTTYYADADSDAYGDFAATIQDCSAPSGYVGNDDDCDDGNEDINPAATEACNGYDDDCDAFTDEGVTTTYYADSDTDGYGDLANTTAACSAPSGYVADSTDCHDGDANIHPFATELCNGIDDDCDALVDEGVTTTYYADDDDDGYGDIANTTAACTLPVGYTSDTADCDDTDEFVNPDATEACNGYDDDCDSLVDESGSTGESTYYADDDSDTYGNPDETISACSQPTGYVSNDEDCEDGDFDINPDAADVCDTLDNDCDGDKDDMGDCPCAVEEYNDHSYMFCVVQDTWANDRTRCLSYGYDLIAINDLAENTWAVFEANSRALPSDKWWTGGNDSAVEGTWTWSNGDTWSYTNWHSGEPNNVGSGGEDCMQLGRFGDSTWNDEPCTSSFRSICEG